MNIFMRLMLSALALVNAGIERVAGEPVDG